LSVLAGVDSYLFSAFSISHRVSVLLIWSCGLKGVLFVVVVVVVVDAAARRAIEESMAGALMKACIPRSAVQAVCLALAGVDSPSDGEGYLSWMRCSFLHPFS
jgi:hypothetical protein